MGGKSQGEAEDLIVKAAKAPDDLYNIRDVYFPANPDDILSKLQTDSDLSLKLLDSTLQAREGGDHLHWSAAPQAE